MEEENNSTNSIEKDINTEYHLLGGRIISRVQPGDEIVISGISGSFPCSNNVHEFKENLFNKVNMVSPNVRWKIAHPEIPPCTGTISNMDLYDSGFFGVHERQAQSLDPMNSILQEKTMEAILDAGLHPSDLQNAKTGVYIGVANSENDPKWFFENLGSETYAFTGTERSMLAHRLSYFFKLKGPSYTTDTACSSSMYALEHAYRAIRLGEIDNAIVAGANMCFHPFITLQLARLGVLTKGSTCRPFDETGNGYIRSEAIGVLLLQKAKNAKRSYAEVIHAKTNCDGFNEKGITFPSRIDQRKLLTDLYDECGIDRYSLSYLETHGTGTPVGDPEESAANDIAFAMGRTKPLLIGSVKSNIAHTETASGICSVIKCIIAMETGLIPPNINYNRPRPEIAGLVEGRMKVVTEETPLKEENALLGVNNFGLGGCNSHVLLRRNSKTKINSDAKYNHPRLVCVSGRTEQAVSSLLNSISDNTIDAEYIKLLHDAFRKNVENHLYRGYTLLSSSGEVARSVKFLKHFSDNSPHFYVVFGELHNWDVVASDLMVLPLFSIFLERIHQVLLKRNVNILNILLKKSSSKGIGVLLGSVLTQMALTELFNLLEIKPTGAFGYSSGELVRAYYLGLLSFEDTINCAFIIDKAFQNNTKIVKSNNNGQGNKHVNGNYVENGINENHVFANLENGSDHDSNNKNLTRTTNDLTQQILKEINSNENSVDSKNVKKIINAIFSNVFENNYMINSNSVVLKIGDGPSNGLEDIFVISIFYETTENYVVGLLKAIGSLYELGYNPQVSKLYPPVDLPVSRGTQMISPYVKWNHRKPKYVPLFDVLSNQANHKGSSVQILIDDHRWTYLKGHVIDGKNLFPVSGYLYVVWETFANINSVPMDMMNICFENCKFIKATTIPTKSHLTLHVNIQSSNGDFEIMEKSSLIVTGKISLLGLKAQSEDLRQYNFDYSRNPTGPKLKSRDIYKELRLRGYNYQGAFRKIEECNIDGSNAFVRWENNWVTLMDSMLQLMTLQSDSRSLYLPTSISKLTILARTHLELVATKPEKGPHNIILPVSIDLITRTIRCGGINIWDVQVASIPRGKILPVPVLESYTFVPNCTELDIHRSTRVNIQIIVENALPHKFTSIELIDDFTDKDVIPLSPIIKSAVDDQALVQPFLKIFSETPIDDIIGVEIEDQDLKNERGCLLVVATNIVNRPDTLREAFNALTENGFIISRESRHYVSKHIDQDFSLLTIHKTLNETLLLLRKKSKTKKSKHIKIKSTEDFDWLPKLQDVFNKGNNDDVVLYAENDPKNGIMGLVNCLRREAPSKNVRCVFVMDKTTDFNPQVPIYADQLRKQMALNVYKHGQWGTYRHLLLSEMGEVKSEHCFISSTISGNLSTLRWIEGPLRCHMKEPSEQELIHVYYSALNLRDIMIYMGKIDAGVGRLDEYCIQGQEFSGRDKQGKCVMGMKNSGALSTLVLSDVYLTFPIPDAWSLEEAATVPVAYGTAIYALCTRGEIKKGESILIHSGTGGVGQAAIRLALHHGCKVFTTVGATEKREFLKKTFPQLEENNIGNSHDESFEQMILRGTNGRGVDLVLNSLAEEKLIASVRCLAKGGRFLDIGKYDLKINNHLSLLLFQKEANYQGVMLHQLFQSSPEVKTGFKKIMIKYIKSGVIKPLDRVVFKYNEVKKAFRFMARGKHMGKALIQIRNPEESPNSSLPVTKFPGTGRYICDPDKVYVIVGGLGGFGLELADWLILKGARKVVLTSRKGITTGYQNYRLSIWRSYGVITIISTAQVATPEGCRQLIETSLKLGRIDAIFNLATVLADADFENQTTNSFFTSFNPKAYATENLDQLSRKMCPDLRDFVVFSSITCGRGNMGQTNYGMANSVIERICEERKQAGYPALAIEWGAIGEVGVLTEMFDDNREVEIGGTLQQRISSCLQVMDTFLKQKEAAVVSSNVMAEKKITNTADNMLDAVIKILGLKDSRSVSLHSTLAELGADSMMCIEVKHILERDFGVFLSAKDIRRISLTKLKKMQNSKLDDNNKEQKNISRLGIETILRLVGSEFQNYIPYMAMNSKIPSNYDAPTVLLFPGIEGFANVFESFTEDLEAYAVAVQLSLGGNDKNIIDIVQSIMPTVDKYFPNKEFNIVAYSFGTMVALEVVNILESRGYNGTLICIDGAPMLTKQFLINLGIQSEMNFETALLCHILSFYISVNEIDKHKERIFNSATWDNRLNLALEIIKHRSYSETQYQKDLANSFYMRAKAALVYTPPCTKLRTNVILIKPDQVTVANLPVDYDLSKYFEKPIQIHTLEGNHSTILENKTLPALINSWIRPPLTNK